NTGAHPGGETRVAGILPMPNPCGALVRRLRPFHLVNPFVTDVSTGFVDTAEGTVVAMDAWEARLWRLACYARTSIGTAVPVRTPSPTPVLAYLIANDPFRTEAALAFAVTRSYLVFRARVEARCVADWQMWMRFAWPAFELGVRHLTNIRDGALWTFELQQALATLHANEASRYALNKLVNLLALLGTVGVEAQSTLRVRNPAAWMLYITEPAREAALHVLPDDEEVATAFAHLRGVAADARLDRLNVALCEKLLAEVLNVAHPFEVRATLLMGMRITESPIVRTVDRSRHHSVAVAKLIHSTPGLVFWHGAQPRERRREVMDSPLAPIRADAAGRAESMAYLFWALECWTSSCCRKGRCCLYGHVGFRDLACGRILIAGSPVSYYEESVVMLTCGIASPAVHGHAGPSTAAFALAYSVGEKAGDEPSE
ncbi:MAG TPA: hypothetical protein VKD22_12420, partial [Ramlibacter sp.]|nr:hypothetical protein [Ramlibacter sp.]